MNKKMIHRSITLIMVFVLLTVDGATALSVFDVNEAQAANPLGNVIVGFLRVVGAGNRRRRVYIEAKNTQKEMDAYYNQLITKTQSIRTDLIANASTGETSPQFIRSYIRLEAALQAEHTAVTQMIEKEKNQARRDFNRVVGQEIIRILIASPGGQQLIGRVRDTLTRVKEAAVAVQTAANASKPLDALKDNLVNRYGEIRQLRNAVRNLGSLVGHKLDHALGGVLSRVENAMDDVEGQMGQAIEFVDKLDSTVAYYDEQERLPISLVEDDGSLGVVIPVDRANAVLDVVSDAYSGAAALHGALKPGTSREDMRTEIRGFLLQQRLEGYDLSIAEHDVGETFCSGASRDQYKTAALQLGLPVETPLNPEDGRYMVCYHIQSGVPIHAYMVGRSLETTPAVETTPTPTPEEEDTTKGSAVVLKGSFVLEGEIDDEDIIHNTIELRFYPEGGPVSGTGFYEFRFVDLDGTISQLRADFQFDGESFPGEDSSTGQASGTAIMTVGQTVVICSWQADYYDGIFEGFLWNPENYDPGEELYFVLTY